MKKSVALWICTVLMLLFSACSATGSSSQSAVICYGPTEFASQEALIEHLAEQEDMRHLFYLNEEFAGLPLQRIELSYDYIRCAYAASKEDLSYPDQADIITVSWNYVSDGEEHLQNALEQNPGIYREIEEHPGYHVSVGEAIPDVVNCQTIYWVFDGCYCSVMSTVERHEDVLAEITGETPIMQRVGGDGEVTE